MAERAPKSLPTAAAAARLPDQAHTTRPEHGPAEAACGGAEPRPAGAHDLEWLGERLQLLPTRALFWPARRLLLVADVHLGKAATLRREGVPIPGGSGHATLARLAASVAATGAREVIVLGDLLHARAGRTAALDRLVRDWVAALARDFDCRWSLLAGNHDHAAGIPPDWGLGAVEEDRVLGPFVLRHHPDPSPRGYVLCGHTHPAVRLQGRGGARARLPCFWFGAAVGVLPAFGEMTGHYDVQPQAGDRVFVLADDRVVPVGA